MSKGRRYNNEPKLNIKKVIAVVIALLLMITFIIAIKNLLNSDSSSNHLISKTYFVYNKNNKWGVIDNNGDIVIEPTYEDAIIIPNSKKAVFICTDSADYAAQTYHTKVYNEKGQEILTGYDKVIALENYDENYNLWYEENVLLVEKNGKYGLIDLDGKVLLDAVYDQISTLKGVKNSLVTEQNGKKGLVTDTGKVMIENKYEDIQALGKDVKAYIVKSNNLYGVYPILDCKYQEIKALNNQNVFCVKENNSYKVIDKDGNKVFNEKFSKIEAIQDNFIIYQYNKKYNAYDMQNKKKFDKSYSELKYTTNGLFIFKDNTNYGIIDNNEIVKLKDEYTSIQYYDKVNIYELEKKDSEDIRICNQNLEEFATGIVNEVNYDKSYIKIWTEEGYQYYNLNGEKITAKEALPTNNLFLSKQNGKYGLVDKEGNIVVDYIYDDAREQNLFGYIAVKKDGLWGCLDKKGKMICDPKYNLDNNLLIDFIGTYHIGEDINFIFYTK